MLLGGIVNKVKLIAAGVFAAILPILYILGRKDGAKKEEVKQIKASAKASEERAEFYKGIQKVNNEIESTKPTGRDELTDRLRQNGL